ncbi:hypothetical protein OC845_005623 [Tilletia horrida]|nr:hypothetical protein OC845_005623 [Tilletia horrida]
MSAVSTSVIVPRAGNGDGANDSNGQADGTSGNSSGNSINTSKGSQSSSPQTSLTTPSNSSSTTSSSTSSSSTSASSAVTAVHSPAQSSPVATASATSSSSVPSPSQCPAIAGPAAGAALGGIVAGLLAGILLACFICRRRQNSSGRSTSTISNADEKFSDDHRKRISPMSTPSLPVLEYKKEAGRAAVGAQNLTSAQLAAVDAAFSSKFDVKSEKDLVGELTSWNDDVEQIAMEITADRKSSRQGAKAVTSSLPKDFGPAADLLESISGNERAQRFEEVVHHILNWVAYEAFGRPFCFVASSAENKCISSTYSSIVRNYDEAQAARWRVMTHTALRKRSKDATGGNTLREVQAKSQSMLATALVWAGLETSDKAAQARLVGIETRLHDSLLKFGALVIELREGMTSSDFQIAIVPNRLANGLGLVANQVKSKPRSLLAAS